VKAPKDRRTHHEGTKITQRHEGGQLFFVPLCYLRAFVVGSAWLALLAALPVFAAEPPKLTVKSEIADPPKACEPAVRKLLADRAVGVSDSAGAICTLWLRKELPIAAGKGEPTYRANPAGTLVGVIRLARPWSDFRGNEAPAGDYTLRLAVQPESKDHEGTAPYRDFCILVPAAEDTKPDVLPFKTLVQKSSKATGGTHPVVMLLVPHPKPPAEPTLIVKVKRIALGVRVKEDFGFGFTLVGAWTD
jgi:hypothetical protein